MASSRSEFCDSPSSGEACLSISASNTFDEAARLRVGVARVLALRFVPLVVEGWRLLGMTGVDARSDAFAMVVGDATFDDFREARGGRAEVGVVSTLGDIVKKRGRGWLMLMKGRRRRRIHKTVRVNVGSLSKSKVCRSPNR